MQHEARNAKNATRNTQSEARNAKPVTRSAHCEAVNAKRATRSAQPRKKKKNQHKHRRKHHGEHERKGHPRFSSPTLKNSASASVGIVVSTGGRARLSASECHYSLLLSTV
jgi:hypothetical protein